MKRTGYFASVEADLGLEEEEEEEVEEEEEEEEEEAEDYVFHIRSCSFPLGHVRCSVFNFPVVARSFPLLPPAGLRVGFA